MKIKKSSLDTFMIILMYAQLTILGFFGLAPILNKVLAVLIVLRLTMFKEAVPRAAKLAACMLAVVYAATVMVSDPFSLSVFKDNLLMLLYPLLYAYYITCVCVSNPKVINNLIIKGAGVFNLTMVINVIVMLVQIFRPYSIMATPTSAIIEYYPDLISGLFPYASTHAVCVFATFVFLYNYSYARRFHGRKRILLHTYNIVLLALQAYISLHNDNKAFFLIFPIFFFVYWQSDPSTSFNSKLTRLIVIFCAAVPLAAILYMASDSFAAFVDNNFLKLITYSIKSYSMGASRVGSGERIAIIGDALGRGSTYLLGDGFAKAFVYTSGYRGYVHFGQADLSTFLVLGGIWFTLAALALYCKIFCAISSVSGKQRSRLVRYGIILIAICIGIFTQSFTNPTFLMPVLLLMLTFRARELRAVLPQNPGSALPAGQR